MALLLSDRFFLKYYTVIVIMFNLRLIVFYNVQTVGKYTKSKQKQKAICRKSCL